MSVNRISFEITNACNLDCSHCLRESATRKKYLPIELFEKVITQAKRYGATTIIVTGGEPLLHPKVEEMIDKVVDLGYVWHIVTNGTLLDRLSSLVNDPHRRSKLQMTSVSLDGATAKTNDAVRGKGSFMKVMKTMSYMKAKGLPLGFKTSLNTLNVGEMEDMVNLGSKLGAAFVEFSHMHPTPELIKLGLVIPRDKWAEIDKEIARLSGIYKMRIGQCAGGRCSLAFAQCASLQMHDIHFDYEGNMSACCILPNFRGSGANEKSDIAGNIADHDFWELHSRLARLLAGVNQAKIKKIGENKMAESDYYQCMFCLKHFNKMDWLKDLDPNNEWIKDKCGGETNEKNTVGGKCG